MRDEKVKVLRSLTPIATGRWRACTVRGQYQAGAIDGQPVPGYLDELAAPSASDRETFVALRAEIDNWRWAGVPFYLRTGKRLPRALLGDRASSSSPRRIPSSAEAPAPIRANRLIIRLQPNEGVR